MDIKDIEFRMTNDASRIQALISGASASSGRDLIMLKPFVFLHPTSYFGKQSRVLQLTEEDMHTCPHYKGKLALSHRHQILCYLVVDTDWSYNIYQETYNLPWTCPNCELTVCLPPMERLQHKTFTCSSRTIKKEEDVKVIRQNKPNGKEFKCDSCEKTLFMTPVEILMHKKSCKMK
ncbi:ATP-dependent RNA helicase [Operophtera brumata]|uniref:ATP-dependent RNA helicase n=1 Tax=Operophtera brumata TaxID=104452 RepID=A0A0L7LEU6_OPEBR|nr:ATP-dependent RNA helicase [Operophtera brumata]